MINQADTDAGFKAIIRPLLFLAGLFFLNFSARIVFAPLMPVIEAEVGISHQEAGLFFLLTAVGYCMSLLGANFVLSRLTHRTIIVCSTLAVGIVLMGIAFCHNRLIMQCGLFIVGLATGIYLPSAIATITSLAASPFWGRALAIHELAPNLSFIMVPLIAQTLLGFLPWRGVIFLFGAASLAMGIAYWQFGKGGDFHSEPPSLKAYASILKQNSFWLMLLLFSMGITATMGIYNVFPLFLVNECGFDLQPANYLLGLSRIPAPIMAIIGGWAVDWMGPKKTLLTAFSISGFFTIMLGLIPGHWVILVLFLQTMAAVCFFPAGFAILSSIGRPETRNIVVSIAVSLAFIVGGGIIPTLIGTIGDLTHSFALGISLTGGFILCGVLVTAFLRLPTK